MTELKNFDTDDKITATHHSEFPIKKLGIPGLSIEIDKNEEKIFKLRIRVQDSNKKTRDSKITLGTHPAMTLFQARQVAKEYHAKINDIKNKFKVEAILNTVTRINADKNEDVNSGSEKIYFIENEPPQPNQSIQPDKTDKTDKMQKHPKNSGSFKKYPPSFRNMEDAGEFLKRLFSWRKILTDEIYYALNLLILIPSIPDKIFHAQWSEFDQNYMKWTLNEQWTIKEGQVTSHSIWTPPLIAFLSQEASSILAIMRSTRLPDNTDGTSPLFPTLFSLQKNECNKKIEKDMKIPWKNYLIQPEGFRFFFRNNAYQSNLYNSEIIEAMMAHDAGDESSENYGHFITEMHQISQWWADQLRKFSGISHQPQFQDINNHQFYSTHTPYHSPHFPYTHTQTPASILVQPEPQNIKPASYSYSIQDVTRWFNLSSEMIQNAYEDDLSATVELQTNECIIANYRNLFMLKIYFSFDQNHVLNVNSQCSCLEPYCQHSAIVLLNHLRKYTQSVDNV
jgi:hypothetical protein